MKFIVGFLLGTVASAFALQSSTSFDPVPAITQLRADESITLTEGERLVCSRNPVEFEANSDASWLYVDYTVPVGKTTTASLAFNGEQK